MVCRTEPAFWDDGCADLRRRAFRGTEVREVLANTYATSDVADVRLLDISHAGRFDRAPWSGRAPRPRLVAERRIPFVKWGHLLRFDPDEIAAWLDRARRPDEGNGTAGRAS